MEQRDAKPQGSVWRRKVADPLLRLLKQGVTPRQLAFGVALGLVVGVFPVVGATTILCLVLASVFRLNHIAVQTGNWVAYPFLLMLVIPFVRFGEFVTRSEQFPISPARLKEVASEGAVVFFQTFSQAILHGIIGWSIVAPLAIALLFVALLPLFRLWKRKEGSAG